MDDFEVGLLPVINEGSRILILGTMPGDDSLRLKQYYANVNNQFWKILSRVYGEAIEAEYSQRLYFLHGKRLALWDVLRGGERKGSLDSAIKEAVFNDFAALLMTYANLKAIFFNGGKAPTLFLRHIERSQPTLAKACLRKIVLPSTSPTPGKNVLSFEEKVVRWGSLTTL